MGFDLTLAFFQVDDVGFFVIVIRHVDINAALSNIRENIFDFGAQFLVVIFFSSMGRSSLIKKVSGRSGLVCRFARKAGPVGSDAIDFTNRAGSIKRLILFVSKSNNYSNHKAHTAK